MKKFYFTLILALFAVMARAAYLENVPITVKQPDGTVLHLFATGDENYRYVFDAEGYTLLRNPKTGYVVYAVVENDRLVPSEFVYGKISPATKGIVPGLKFTEKDLATMRYVDYNADLKTQSLQRGEPVPNHGTMNNIVIFVRFSDDPSFSEVTYNEVDAMFNATTGSSVHNYFEAASYGQYHSNSYLFPEPSSTGAILSYVDSQPRAYYEPYVAGSNEIGYLIDPDDDINTSAHVREMELLSNICSWIATENIIPSSINLDYDGNDEVDNVILIVQGDPGGWDDILWPHRWNTWGHDNSRKIGTKFLYNYNLQLEGDLDVGVLCHEQNHTLGAPDLYHGYDPHTSSSLSGRNVMWWDLQSNQTNPPQQHVAYMKQKYDHWLAEEDIEDITGNYGTYNLVALGDPATGRHAYKIRSSDSHQYYYIEYRDTTLYFDSKVPHQGLIIYRVDDRYERKTIKYKPEEGIFDEVYIFRPGVHFVDNVYWDVDEYAVYHANFSPSAHRTEFNSTTDPRPFLTGGTYDDHSINIYDIQFTETGMSFKYGNPDLPVITSAITAPNPICAGTALTLTAPSYANATGTGWQISSTSDFAIAGEYTGQALDASYNHWYLRYYAANGVNVVYSNTVQITVDGYPVIASFTAPDEICEGESFALPTPTVTWNNATNTGTTRWEISSTATGTYTTFTNSNVSYSVNGYYLRYAAVSYCFNTYSEPFQITVNGRPEIAAFTAPDAICEGETFELPTPVVTWNHTSGEGETQWEICSTATGTYTAFTNTDITYDINGYYIRYAATNDCFTTYSDPVQITVNAVPVLTGTVTAPDEICEGEAFDLTSPTITWRHVTDGTSAWMIGAERAGVYSALDNSDIPYEYNGYYIYFSAINGCGETTSDSVPVVVNAVPVVDDIVAPARICAGESFDLTVPEVVWRHTTEGTGQWEICETEDGTYEVLVNENIPRSYNGYYLHYAATNGCGTTFSNAVVLDVNDIPDIETLNQLPDLCSGEPLELYYYTPFISNFDTCGWQLSADEEFTSPMGYYNMLLDTSFDGWYLRFFGLNECGYNYSNTIQITVNPVPEVTLSGVTEICAGESTTLTVGPDIYASYDWYNSQTWLGSGTTFNTGALDYGATFICLTTTDKGCRSLDSIRVTVHPYPGFVITSSTGSFNFINGEDVTLSVPAGYSGYRWYNSELPGEILSTTAELVLEDLQHTVSYCCEVDNYNMCSSIACATLHVDRIHSITVEEGILNGTLTAPEEGIAGQYVQLTATPDEGYLLTSLRYYFDDPNMSYAIDLTTQQFIMPDDDIVVTAFFSLPLTGDANVDGEVNILDVLVTINYILGREPLPFSFVNADVNGDGVIDIADAMGINAIILGSRGDCDPYTAIYEVVKGKFVFETPVAVAGIQLELTDEPLDVDLPAGFTTSSAWVNGRFVFVAYNLSGEMPAGYHALLTLKDGTEVRSVVMATKEGCIVKGEAGTLGVGEESASCMVFPNPTSGKVTVLCHDMTQVSVVSLTGQVLYDAEFAGEQVEIDLSDFADGLYMLMIRTENQTIIRKVSKK